MSLDTAGLVAAIQSHADTTALFERVTVGEPKNAPGNGLSVAVFFSDVHPLAAASGLASATVRVAFTVRVMKPMLSQPYGDIDPDILTATDGLMRAYVGAFTLDGEVRNIDVFGQHGTSLSASSGYVTIDKVMYRVVDITLPMIVNDLWNETP